MWRQRGLSPGAKVVLMVLADVHTEDKGCFPEQKTIAERCGMARSTINEHLNELVAAGLIRRQQRYNQEKKRRGSTLYDLAIGQSLYAHPSGVKRTEDLTPRIASHET